jgi:hypothetical protein
LAGAVAATVSDLTDLAIVLEVPVCEPARITRLSRRCDATVRGVRVEADEHILRKPAFLSHLCIKTIILPRQARDKHRENSKKDAVFRTDPL